ncbi:MAG: hypothetical protein ACR2IP_11710 [Solirubrobacteraceae bacterium]
MSRTRLCLLSTVATFCVLALAPVLARADHGQVSLFQDDAYLIYSPTRTVDHTLATLRSLGVQRVRVNLKWSTVAPAAQSRTRPGAFDDTNPAAYGASWAAYDRIVKLAQRHGIGVELNITDPGPLWAMQSNSPTVRAADHYAPNAGAFFNFVRAVGTRYSGTYHGIPRVHVWSIWNEPNQPGWLAPQSRRYAGKEVPNSPRLYRQYVEAGYEGLLLTSHSTSRDTILVGELAPEGYSTPGFYTAITPMPFMRALYCLDDHYRRLTGTPARALDCPTGGSRQAFVKANPGLFQATGFGHHPYFFTAAPGVSSSNQSFAPIANLGRLERGLDSAFGAYGVQRRIPLYLTEYGYQTKPPDPYQKVSPAEQAAYLNQADYMAWRDPRVREMSQFLLYDSPPDPRFRPSQFGYWDGFQMGLLYASGARKPAYDAYRMPIWIPSPQSRRGARTFIWGQLRAANPLRGAQRAEVQWRAPGGRFRTIATVATCTRTCYLTASVRLPGTGTVQIAWRSRGGLVLVSRSVGVKVR